MSARLPTISPSDLLCRAPRARHGGGDLPIGVLDLFKIGIGPSSSHTMGPMRAAAAFVDRLSPQLLNDVNLISVTLFGSLAWTGLGHATDKALMLGLSGHQPDQVDPDDAERLIRQIRSEQRIVLPPGHEIGFDPERDIRFDKAKLFPRHPNAMRFEAYDGTGQSLRAETWFSIGGGFVELEGEGGRGGAPSSVAGFDFHTADELLDLCRVHQCAIADIALANECARRSEPDTIEAIDRIVRVMMDCIDRGLAQSGELPGALRVKRRARALFQRLTQSAGANVRSVSEPFDYISAFAIAVNEENAAGGRVVTAPTNGAAGVVPAVLRHYRDFCTGADQAGMRIFMLTATAIGGIIKRNASISGAEVGCQGEVGSAAAMASAGLAAALGATNAQIENAAEIAIEHHLGMTCDPVGGLVQIPCI
ncbi:MAG TPA: L-serine ammonia-lyase, partial [Bradyrhizobium sp.]|nr:L-serine ammonia-lyase [Bradyrhizobium sp.]